MERQKELGPGVMPDFPAGYRPCARDDWTVAPAPADLNDRRVEMTGRRPEDGDQRAELGAKCSWRISRTPFAHVAQRHRRPAQPLRGRSTDAHVRRSRGQEYRLKGRPPHWWSVHEAGTWPSRTCWSTARRSQRLFDFGLYFFHNAPSCSTAGRPLLLPAEDGKSTWRRACGTTSSSRPRTRWASRRRPRHGAGRDDPGGVRDGRDPLRAARARRGLNAGRWDYIFSVIKTFRNRAGWCCPDRAQVTMAVPFMRAYTELLVRTCHRRGAHAIGGMAAFIPSRREPEVNERALAKVRDDKEREAGDGFDGTWVAHPDLVPVAARSSTACWASGRTRRTGARGRRRSSAASCSTCTRRRPGHRGGVRPTSRRRCSTSTHGWRQRRGGDQQPDGGRRDGGDLPLAAVAVAVGQRGARRRDDRLGDLYLVHWRGGRLRLGGAMANPDVWTTPRTSSTSWCWTTTSSSS